MTQSEAGKGSTQRPRLISNEEYQERWAAIWADPVKACPVCGGETKNGICQKLLNQQIRDRN